VLRETTSRGLCRSVCPSRTGCVCVFLLCVGVTAVCVYYYSTGVCAMCIINLFAWGEGDSGGHVPGYERRRTEACVV
jgi:hypothetical protein